MKRKPLTRLTPEYEAMIRRLDAMFDKNRETLSPESFPGQRRAMLAEIDALRLELAGNKERIRLAEQNRCVSHVSKAADDAREANRKKAAAELDLLARDIADYREVM